MKMEEAAPLILKIIKTNRKIQATEIALKTGIKIRRVYDVTIILEALDLIDIELPERGWGKVYVWRGTKTIGKSVRFNSNKITVKGFGGGLITRVENHPEKVIIHSDSNLIVENYMDFLNS